VRKLLPAEQQEGEVVRMRELIEHKTGKNRRLRLKDHKDRWRSHAKGGNRLIEWKAKG